jgi:alpha-ribazole phosphatase
VTLFVWRHPLPIGAAGLCLGRTDLPVDRRKAKRLAHRIRAHARRHRLARVVVTSPSVRCAAVGRVLADWGWRHRVDARLAELDFGAWDGRAWSAIGEAEVRAWTDDFATHAPGGGESVHTLLVRCRAVLAECRQGSDSVCAVAHAGWISAATWCRSAEGSAGALPSAAQWPAAIGHGRLLAF